MSDVADMHIHEILFSEYVHPPHEKKRTKLFKGENFDKLYETALGIVAVSGNKLSRYPWHLVWQVNYHPDEVTPIVTAATPPVSAKQERTKKPRPIAFSGPPDLEVEIET